MRDKVQATFETQVDNPSVLSEIEAAFYADMSLDEFRRYRAAGESVASPLAQQLAPGFS